MSEPEHDRPADPPAPGAVADEEVDALPVLADRARIVPTDAFPQALPADRRQAGAMIPAVQAAAVAAGGFVAGAAVVGWVHRRRRQAPVLAKGRRQGRDLGRGGRGGRRGGRAGELVQIVGSRSLLVDVHLLGGPGAER
ncbi:MAG TPA: hypothetical protein VES97_01675 [Solirubrobacteraceae bacterium]|nr:hypothetical protein [Solirubrobacteraceae bacterium]